MAIKAVVAKYWQAWAFYGGLLLLFGGLLWWHLGTLTHGYGGREAVTMLNSTSLHSIFHNPINAPFTLLTHGLLRLKPDSLLMVRLAATIFGLFTLSAFYWLARYWHGQRAAIFGTLLFGASAWFLHAARLGTPDVLLFGLLMLAGCGVWLRRSGKALPVMACLLLAAVFLYVPGMVWFILAGVIWQWKAIDRIFKRHLGVVTASGFLFLAILAPLGLAIYHTPQLGKLLIGLPAVGWPQPLDTLRSIAEVPLQIIWRGPQLPELWLGRSPILDAFCLALLFLGAYVYAKHRKLVRTQMMVVILVLGTILAGLTGPVTLGILVPFVYIVITAGIGLLLNRWFAVFPRNPIAQAVGLGLVSIAVLASCWYGYRHYFVAWPAAPATKAAFPIAGALPSATIKR